MLNASQHQMNRAALSAESTNSTPPLAAGLLATTPDGPAVEQAEPDDQLGREQRLDLEEALGVDQARRSRRACRSACVLLGRARRRRSNGRAGAAAS